MKSILYIGAVLMIGASVYGFVDYKKTSRNKEFKSLYHEEKKEPVLSEKTEPRNLSKEEHPAKTNDITEKLSVKNKMSKKGPVEEKILESINNKDEKSPAEDKSGEFFKPSKVKKNKKLNYKLFSRAPLREYSEEAILPELKESKTEEVKPVNQ